MRTLKWSSHRQAILAVLALTLTVMVRQTAGAEPEPQGAVLSPDGRNLYVASATRNRVTVIDALRNRVITQIAVCGRPSAIAFSSNSKRAYVSCEGDASVAILDAVKHTLINTVRLPGRGIQPSGISVAPGDQVVYVTTGPGGTVIALEAKDCTILGSVQMGPSPQERGLTARTRDTVPSVDPVSMKTIEKVPTGRGPSNIGTVPHF